MKTYKLYGSENTHLELSEKAYKAYSSIEPIEVWERESDKEDEHGNIVTDEAGNAIKEYSYAIHGAFEETGMTAIELNELLEEIYETY